MVRAQRRRPPPPPPREPPPIEPPPRLEAEGEAPRLEAPRELSICVLRPEPYPSKAPPPPLLERQQLFVPDGLDEPGAEERNRNPAREDRRVVGHHDLAAVAGHREQLKQRLARGIERLELALRVPPGRAQFENDAAAADGRHVVADRAARAVERRAEAFVRRLDFEEVLEAQSELRELGRRDAGERVRRAEALALRDEVRRRRPAREHHDGRQPAAHLVTTIVPRMNEWPAPHTCEHSNG